MIVIADDFDEPSTDGRVFPLSAELDDLENQRDHRD